VRSQPPGGIAELPEIGASCPYDVAVVRLVRPHVHMPAVIARADVPEGCVRGRTVRGVNQTSIRVSMTCNGAAGGGTR
jgi:hypothetical protein